MARIGIDATIIASPRTHLHAGVSRTTVEILNELVTRPGHELVIFIDAELEPPAAWNLPHVKIEKVSTMRKVVWNFTEAGRLAQAHNVDFWLGMHPHCPIIGKFKRGLMVYDLFPLEMPETVGKKLHWTMKLALPPSLRKADVAFCISEYTKDSVKRIFRAPDSKLLVAYLGPGNIQPPRDSVTREELQAIGVEFDSYFFALSTLEPRKNLPRLLEAFAKLNEPGLGLVIGGAKGWLYDPVFERLKELGIEERVKFLGFVESEAIPALFAGCEAFVYPSLKEGFGIPVLEGMLYGAPVITSKGGSLEEVGGDAVTYLDPMDVDDMARVLRASLEPKDREAIRQKGFERAATFTWKCTVDEILKGIEATLG